MNLHKAREDVLKNICEFIVGEVNLNFGTSSKERKFSEMTNIHGHLFCSFISKVSKNFGLTPKEILDSLDFNNMLETYYQEYLKLDKKNKEENHES